MDEPSSGADALQHCLQNLVGVRPSVLCSNARAGAGAVVLCSSLRRSKQGSRHLALQQGAALAWSSAVLRPPQMRQQLRRSQMGFLLNVIEHCGESGKDAFGWATLNDVSEGVRNANGDELLEGRRPRERNVRCQLAEPLGKEAGASQVEYEARFRRDALQCVEGAGRFDGHRNLAALHAELVHEIGARLGHFHFECSAIQLRVHGEAAFAEVTARAVSLGGRKAVLVTRSRR